MFFKSNSTLPYILAILLTVAIILVILQFIEDSNSKNNYNNGICSLCDGHYVFHQAVGHAYSTRYIYKCDKCGNLIEVSRYYGE